MHWCNYFCRGWEISITYSERVFVALVIQRAKWMRRIILSSVASLAPPHFSTFSHKRHDFQKNNSLNIKHVFWLSLQIWILFYFNHNSARYFHKCAYVIIYCTRYSFLILIKSELSLQILETCSNTKFHENSSSGSRVVPCGRTEKQTDMTKLIFASCNFEKAPKNKWLLPSYPPVVGGHLTHVLIREHHWLQSSIRVPCVKSHPKWSYLWISPERWMIWSVTKHRWEMLVYWREDTEYKPHGRIEAEMARRYSHLHFGL